MLKNGLAYHTVVNAMRNQSRNNGEQRFVIAIKASINGHVPYGAYRQAATERQRDGWTETDVANAVTDWLITDINPAIQLLRTGTTKEHVIEIFNYYNQYAPLAVRTELKNGAISRKMVNTSHDDALCAAGTLTVAQEMQLNALKNVASPKLKTIQEIASYLGVENMASADVMSILNAEGDKDLSTLSSIMGNSNRTLQRQLAHEGVTLKELRMASRHISAFNLLRKGTMSACDIAIYTGYSDQAHMIRGFKQACGLTPGQISQVFAQFKGTNGKTSESYKD